MWILVKRLEIAEFTDKLATPLKYKCVKHTYRRECAKNFLVVKHNSSLYQKLRQKLFIFLVPQRTVNGLLEYAILHCYQTSFFETATASKDVIFLSVSHLSCRYVPFFPSLFPFVSIPIFSWVSLLTDDVHKESLMISRTCCCKT